MWKCDLNIELRVLRFSRFSIPNCFSKQTIVYIFLFIACTAWYFQNKPNKFCQDPQNYRQGENNMKQAIQIPDKFFVYKYFISAHEDFILISNITQKLPINHNLLNQSWLFHLHCYFLSLFKFQTRSPLERYLPLMHMKTHPKMTERITLHTHPQMPK